MAISKCPDNAGALKISIFLLSIRPLRQTGCSPSFEDSCVPNARESSSLLEQVGADEDDQLGRGRHRNRKTTGVSIILRDFVTSRYGSCGLRHDHKRWHHKQRTFYGSSAVLKSPRDCTMLRSSMRRVGLIDITAGNATRLGASQRSATRRCASQHIATQRLSRWGSPAARARSA
jgi:hypothetical protein